MHILATARRGRRLLASLLSLALLAAASAAVASEVYKWTDEHGRVHYSQTPPPQGVSADKRTFDDGVGSSSKARGPYCIGVAVFAGRVARAMYGTRSFEEALQIARSGARELLDAGAGDEQLRAIATYVEGMRGAMQLNSMSPDEIGQLARDRCMAGSFAADRGDSDAAGTSNGSDAPTLGARSGTGWFAGPGVVVTSLHVVLDSTRIRLYLHDGSKVDATLVDHDAANDIAILATGVTNVPGLALRGDEAGIGTPVFTIGFPHTSVMGVSPKLADGVISSIKGMQDDESRYQISVPVQAGNSGGPLLDMNGAVVGIVSSKLRAGTMYTHTGDVTENVNYAIKSTRVVRMLRHAAPVAPGPQSLQALASVVTPSVVRIIAE